MFGFEGAANVLDFPKSPVKSSRSPAKRVREEEETQRNERVLVRAKTRDMELALTTWPVGQVVKTAASHAVNIGSNPVRVTRYAPLAQLVEQLTLNQWVPGSSP